MALQLISYESESFLMLNSRKLAHFNKPHKWYSIALAWNSNDHFNNIKDVNCGLIWKKIEINLSSVFGQFKNILEMSGLIWMYVPVLNKVGDRMPPVESLTWINIFGLQ